MTSIASSRGCELCFGGDRCRSVRRRDDSHGHSQDAISHPAAECGQSLQRRVECILSHFSGRGRVRILSLLAPQADERCANGKIHI